MPRLAAFVFNITTIDGVVDIQYWKKNDDIKETFIVNDSHAHIHCCVDYFTNGIGRCHIYSLPPKGIDSTVSLTMFNATNKTSNARSKNK
ncbi:unnamed protein product [Rotaria sp. Silwood1]|nr:unnamed protein product [Rotaria sp. Silwood1]